MQRIWKYLIPVGDVPAEFTLTMPVNAIIHTLALQEGVPFIWVQVDEAANKLEVVRFFLLWTGQPFATGLVYIGTFQQNDLVWHLFVSER
jgi:hypothetical protein